MISELLGIPWGKDELIASREMDQSGTDIRLLGEAAERFKFAVECKSAKVWNIQASIKQAQANCPDGSDWLLVHKRRSQTKAERIPPVVVMDALAFFKLLGRLNG
jgi:hypothetical protein